MLPGHQKGLPNFVPPLRNQAGPLRILSMMRLCSLVAETARQPRELLDFSALLRYGLSSRKQG